MEGTCDYCKYKTGHTTLFMKGTCNYYECRKCQQRFCENCRKYGPACPKCNHDSVKVLGQLGRDF